MELPADIRFLGAVEYVVDSFNDSPARSGKLTALADGCIAFGGCSPFSGLDLGNNGDDSIEGVASLVCSERITSVELRLERIHFWNRGTLWLSNLRSLEGVTPPFLVVYGPVGPCYTGHFQGVLSPEFNRKYASRHSLTYFGGAKGDWFGMISMVTRGLLFAKNVVEGNITVIRGKTLPDDIFYSYEGMLPPTMQYNPILKITSVNVKQLLNCKV